MMELRLATGETLSALLDQSKQYLSMAEDLYDIYYYLLLFSLKIS